MGGKLLTRTAPSLASAAFRASSLDRATQKPASLSCVVKAGLHTEHGFKWRHLKQPQPVVCVAPQPACILGRAPDVFHAQAQGRQEVQDILPQNRLRQVGEHHRPGSWSWCEGVQLTNLRLLFQEACGQRPAPLIKPSQ